MGSPKLEDVADVIDGDLLKRRHGLRRDDLIEILMDARSLVEGHDPWIRGRLLSSGKTSLELLGEIGRAHV